MSPNRRVQPVLVSIAATATLLLIGAALVYPEQSPILPIQISVLLAALGGWIAWRRSNAALRVAAGLGTLLAVFGLHPFVGDLGKPAKELVPDLLIIVAAAAMTATAVRGLRSHRREAALA